jgi:hypothetical protein
MHHWYYRNVFNGLEYIWQIAEPGSPAVFAGRPGRVRRRETSGNANAGENKKNGLFQFLLDLKASLHNIYRTTMFYYKTT